MLPPILRVTQAQPPISRFRRAGRTELPNHPPKHGNMIGEVTNAQLHSPEIVIGYIMILVRRFKTVRAR